MSSTGVKRRLSQFMPSGQSRCVLVHVGAGPQTEKSKDLATNSIAHDIGRCGVDGLIFDINDEIRPLDIFLGKKAPALLIHVEPGDVLRPHSSNTMQSSSFGSNPDEPVMEAFRLGASAIATDFMVGHDTDEGEARNFRAVSQLVAKSEELGLPCLVAAIPMGNRITKETYADCVGLASRMASEAGAQCVAIPYSGARHSTMNILQAIGVPTFLLQLEKEFSRFQPECNATQLVDTAISVGACGVILSSPRTKTEIDQVKLAVRAVHGAEPE